MEKSYKKPTEDELTLAPDHDPDIISSQPDDQNSH